MMVVILLGAMSASLVERDDSHGVTANYSNTSNTPKFLHQQLWLLVHTKNCLKARILFLLEKLLARCNAIGKTIFSELLTVFGQVVAAV
jgi:hypothetical protein